MKILYFQNKDERSKDVDNIIEKDFPHILREKNPDLIFVSGGDGAMLHAIQSFGHLRVPFFGYANGTLNFLMNSIPMNNLKKTIKDLEKDKIELQEIITSKIDVQLLSKNKGKEYLGFAVNEVVIGSTIMGYHSFTLNSEDNIFTDFKINGSGLCISTDLGSTGYNFNLGGPVLPLGSNLWSISGIVCNRHLEDIIKINKLRVICECQRTNPTIFLDGIDKNITLEKGDEIILKKGSNTKILFQSKDDFLKKRLEIISRYRKL
jgi:NAD kinase